MGEARKDALRVGFDRSIKLEFHGARLSSDAGLFPYRDLDDAAKLTESGAAGLFDFRTGSNIQHSMTALLRQSIYSRLAGYEDVNDAERLSVDPVMRHVVGGRAVERQAASTSQVARFETDVLTHPDNLTALMNMPVQWVDMIQQRRPIKQLILDMDSSVSATHGEQEGSRYNGHFGCDCYHPLFIFNQDGDVERALLRPGNVASVDDWRSVLEPVIERYRPRKTSKYFRGDAAFALPELYELLEAEGYRYAIRLKANPILQDQISHLLTRPVDVAAFGKVHRDVGDGVLGRGAQHHAPGHAEQLHLQRRDHARLHLLRRHARSLDNQLDLRGGNIRIGVDRQLQEGR